MSILTPPPPPPLCRSEIAHQGTSGSAFFFSVNHLVRATLLQGYKFEQSQTVFPDVALSCTPKASPMRHSNGAQTPTGVPPGLLQLFVKNNLQGVFLDTVPFLSILITTPTNDCKKLRGASSLSLQHHDPAKAECIGHAAHGEESGDWHGWKELKSLQSRRTGGQNSCLNSAASLRFLWNG